MASISYGPQRPAPQNDYTEFRVPTHLPRFSAKIRYDLERYFRICAGKKVRLFQVDTSAGRCTTCTDSITGQILLSNCPECSGTGYIGRYTRVDDFWVLPEIGPGLRTTSEMGNSENTQNGRDAFVFVGAPMLKDSDLAVFVDTRDVYKVVDMEPRIVALNGDIVTQVANLAFLTPGSPEYRVVDW